MAAGSIENAAFVGAKTVQGPIMRIAIVRENFQFITNACTTQYGRDNKKIE